MASTASIPDVTLPMIWYVLADGQDLAGLVVEDDEELGPDRVRLGRACHRDRPADVWAS